MSNMEKLLEVMHRLRHPQTGCPWDLEQDFGSIAPYTVEEAYEVADAIAREDMQDLRDELGDLLFQVVFHARMASEAGHFDFDDVASSIAEKMERRHPHVFGDAGDRSLTEVNETWEQIKAAERRDKADDSALAGVALALPALKRAQKLGKRASRVGFDWPTAEGPRAKVLEELQELDAACSEHDPAAIREELGDLLFAAVNLARHCDVDAEQALTEANRKFEQRFRAVESLAAAAGESMADSDPERLDRWWREVKQTP